MSDVGRAYYNEIDPYCAQWLRNLIDAGHIATGDVDERSIEDVRPGDLRGYRQCHFFAGLGGWSYALRLAGWPDDLAVWTGSCPCQPFSQAGKGAGFADERHLWPAFAHLISVAAPGIVFGEQVAGESGREWVARVRADLEAMGLSFAAFDLCAASVKAPHKRQRLYWVADTARQDDGCTIRSPIARQASQPGSDFFSSDDQGGQSTLARRRIPDATVPLLAHGIPARLDRYRAISNAIVPQVAAQFIRAYAGG